MFQQSFIKVESNWLPPVFIMLAPNEWHSCRASCYRILMRCLVSRQSFSSATAGSSLVAFLLAFFQHNHSQIEWLYWLLPYVPSRAIYRRTGLCPAIRQRGWTCVSPSFRVQKGISFFREVCFDMPRCFCLVHFLTYTSTKVNLCIGRRTGRTRGRKENETCRTIRQSKEKLWEVKRLFTHSVYCVQERLFQGGGGGVYFQPLQGLVRFELYGLAV